jgi:hypothetical protein
LSIGAKFEGELRDLRFCPRALTRDQIRDALRGVLIVMESYVVVFEEKKPIPRSGDGEEEPEPDQPPLHRTSFEPMPARR